MKHSEIIEKRIADLLAADAKNEKVLEKLYAQNNAICKALGLESFVGYGWDNQLNREMSERDEKLNIQGDETQYELFYQFWAQSPDINGGISFKTAILKVYFRSPRKANAAPSVTREHITGYFMMPMSRALSLDAMVYGPLHSNSYGKFCICTKDKYFNAMLASLNSDALPPGEETADYWEIKKPTRGLF